jgi:hypothetical protein
MWDLHRTVAATPWAYYRYMRVRRSRPKSQRGLHVRSRTLLILNA